MTFIRPSHRAFPDIRLLTTFVWAVVGLISSQKPHLSRWTTYRSTETKASSKERQFSRWLHNDRIRPMLIYPYIVEHMLATWGEEKIFVALDTTLLWKKFVIVRASLVYNNRAIPLGWVVFRSKSATVAVVTYQRMLAQVSQMLPKSTEVILLADRGFAHIELLKLCRQLNWRFRIRVKSTTWIHLHDGKMRQVKTLMPIVGKAYCYNHVWITKKAFGSLYLATATVKTENGTESWAIISDEPVGRHTFAEYGLRFCIEENFLDDKSAGFNLESSRLNDSLAISRLCLILAVATVFLVSTGMAVETLGFRSMIDTHWRRGISYFQIGYRWCQHAIANNKWLHHFLWLPPNPNPDPAIASWKQFHKPMYSLETVVWV